jgi:hypothetical protein
MNNIMKNLSYNSLIVILVAVVFTYIVVNLDEKHKNVTETFSSIDGSIIEKENFEDNPNITQDTSVSTQDTSVSTQDTSASTQDTSASTQDTSASTQDNINESNKNIIDPNADGAGDAGSNIDAIEEDSKQNIVQTNDKKTTIVHNHYYGGNKEIAKFLSALTKEKEDDSKKNQIFDHRMCKELKNKSLAKIKNDRFLFELKNKCNQHAYSESTCKVAPTQDQTSLLGTLLSDASNTKYGSIISK